MNDEVNYKNNPLHGLSLKNLLIEMVDHYGFEILFAYLNVNCFKTNPSIEASVKFLKKMDWAREKVEAFYLYQYKNLPKVSSAQFSVPPRDRIIPEGQVPGEPAELSLEDAERLRERREKKAAEHNKSGGYRAGKKSGSSNGYRGSNNRGSSHRDNDRPRQDDRAGENTGDSPADPWGRWKK